MISSTWRYPYSAYGWLLSTIEKDGVLRKDERGYLCKEVLNVGVTIDKPLEGWPLEGSGWDIPALQKYAEQLVKPDDAGFDYTYGHRLRCYPVSYWTLGKKSLSKSDFELDQLKAAICKLQRSPGTRRAIAITWIPEVDNENENVPCMQTLDFLIRNGKLSLTAFFRSWDCKRAAPANIYGLARLMSQMATEVWARMGSLTIVAASAHIYME